MTNHQLIDVDDSLCIVIDVQSNFTVKLEATPSQMFLERVCWLIGVANWCRVPLIVTVEDMGKAGGPSPEVQRALPPHTPIFNKMIFNLADQADILAEVVQTGRQTAVLVGLETDVCIMQSALGLMSRGYRAVVIADATCSPGEAHAAGLARLRDAGVLITDTKGLFYEWLRTVERTRRFAAECPSLQLPTGLVL
jgi:hypothetical protein